MIRAVHSTSDQTWLNHLNHDVANALRAGICKPPRSFSQWITEELYIPSGQFAGTKFKFTRQPITRLWANEIDSGHWTEFVYSGPSQSGKSLIGYVAPLLYHATELNESLIFAVPAEEMASDKWERDIRPALMASPRLKQLLPTRGPGSGGGTIKDRVILANEALLKIMTAGGSDQAKASFTARIVCITEAARFSRSSTTSAEADPLRQLKARQRSYSFEDRRMFIEGTKTSEQEFPFSLRTNSSNSQILVQCPACGDGISPGRENLIGWQDARTELEARDLAVWCCPKCGEQITEDQRIEALNHAVLVHQGQRVNKQFKVEGDRPKTSRLWFDYSAFHNAFLTAGDIAVDCWANEQTEPETKERDSSEKELSQFVFGECYRPPDFLDSQVTLDSADSRILDLPRGILPEDTTNVALGIDVGERHLHWVVVAARSNDSVHVPDYGIQEVEISKYTLKVAIRLAILEIVNRLSVGLQIKNSKSMKPVRIACTDSGHLPDAVFAAMKCKPLIPILPVLGRGETQLAKRRFELPSRKGNIVRKIDGEGRWYLSRNKNLGGDQLTLDADAYKRIMISGHRIPINTPGAITYFSAPSSVHRKCLKQVIAEQEVLEEIPGEPPKKIWIQNGANHYGDALAYGLCALNRMGWLQGDQSDNVVKEWKF